MNLWMSLGLNVAAPSLILAKLSGAHLLGPKWALILALCFPLGCTLFELKHQKKPSWISVLGLVSVTLTGSLGLLKADLFWFAVKEGAIPTCIATVLLVSAWMKRSLVLELLLNPQLVDWEKIRSKIDDAQKKTRFERLVQHATYAFAASFYGSGAMNFTLARRFLKSEPGSELFNGELAKLHAVAWPMVALPSMVCAFLTLLYFFKKIESITGLTAEEILHAQSKTEPAMKK